MGVSSEYMFQTSEEDDRAWGKLTQQSDVALTLYTYDQEEVGVAVQAQDAERVQPFPHLLRLLCWSEALELGGSSNMDGFGLGEEAEDYCGAG